MWDAAEARRDSRYAEGLARSTFARTQRSHELFRRTAFVRTRYRLGGRSSSRFDATYRMRNLDLRQATPESSGCFERPGVNAPEITRRLNESEKIAQRHDVRRTKTLRWTSSASKRAISNPTVST